MINDRDTNFMTFNRKFQTLLVHLLNLLHPRHTPVENRWSQQLKRTAFIADLRYKEKNIYVYKVWLFFFFCGSYLNIKKAIARNNKRSGLFVGGLRRFSRFKPTRFGSKFTKKIYIRIYYTCIEFIFKYSFLRFQSSYFRTFMSTPLIHGIYRGDFFFYTFFLIYIYINTHLVPPPPKKKKKRPTYKYSQV